jgi:thiamine biosynthesis protein ThiS
MQIELNGQSRDVPDDCTLSSLLQQLNVPVTRVAVEVNEQLVPRVTHANRAIKAGDRVEITTLVGGG